LKRPTIFPFKTRTLFYCVLLIITTSNLVGQNVFSDINHLQRIRSIHYPKGPSFKHWVNVIHFDKNGLLWISAHNLLYTFDGTTIIERASVENNQNISFDRMYEIHDTLYFQNPFTKTYFYPLNSKDKEIKLSNWQHLISAHCITTYQQEFFATNHGAILKYKSGKFDTLFQAYPVDDHKYNPNKGSLLIDQSDENFLWYYYKNTLYHINTKDGSHESFDLLQMANIDLRYINPNGIYSAALTQVDDDLFIGSERNGLTKFHIPSKTWSSYQKKIPVEYIGKEDYVNSVISIQALNDSLLLLGGTIDPFFNINTGTLHKHLGVEKEFNYYKHGFALEKDGDFFLNNFYGGLTILSQENNKFLNHYNFDENKFYGQNSITQDEYWICDNRFIYCLSNSNDTLHKYSAIEIFNEEISNKLLIDNEYFIWLGSTSGLIRFNHETNTFKKFTEFDGLPGKSWIKDFDGRINKDGVVILKSEKLSTSFAPSELIKKDKIEKPYVYEITILNKIYNKLQGEELILNPEENFFNIKFSSKNYQANPLAVYEYKLEGYDEEWKKATNERNVSYDYLPPGKYNFKIKISNQEGNYAKYSDDFKIHLKAHWYESSLFKLGVILFLGCVIFGFFRIRTTALKRELKLKSEFNEALSHVKLEALRSQMNPHFLFNCLNSIDHFILNNDSQKASEYLSKFSKLIRNILDFSKANVISLKQEIESTEIYINMEQMRFINKFNYEITIHPKINQNIKTIPPLILQPYVENSIWHGLLHKEDIGTISIDINQVDQFYIIEIEDDGIGRVKAQTLKSKSATKRKSYGMKITEDRIRLTNQLTGQGGTVQTIDKIDQYGQASGTKVILKLPLV